MKKLLKHLKRNGKKALCGVLVSLSTGVIVPVVLDTSLINITYIQHNHITVS